MFNQDTLQALINLDITGLFEVLFIDGETRVLDVRYTFRDAIGEPMYFVVEDGTVYIWERVISIKKVK